MRRNEEEMVECDWCGLDALVDVLLHEKHTGNFFHHFLVTYDNINDNSNDNNNNNNKDDNNSCNDNNSSSSDSSSQTWLNCYNFWKAVQGK